MKVSICIIATNRYNEYVQPLIDSLREFFLPGIVKTVHLFSDRMLTYEQNEDLRVKQYSIPSWSFPDATLLRYATMTSVDESEFGDYIFYIDADMLIEAAVGTEILYDIVAVRHPGYDQKGGGSWETRPESKTYVPLQNRRTYFAGGFQGGSKSVYFRAMQIMADWIAQDGKVGIIPIWHDESAWNSFLVSDHMREVDFVQLSPSYCMPEPQVKRDAWRINSFTPRIIALEKPPGFSGAVGYDPYSKTVAQ